MSSSTEYIKDFLESLDTRQVYIEKAYEYDPEDVLFIELEKPLKMTVFRDNGIATFVIDEINMPSKQKKMIFLLDGYPLLEVDTLSVKKIKWIPCSNEEIRQAYKDLDSRIFSKFV